MHKFLKAWLEILMLYFYLGMFLFSIYLVFILKPVLFNLMLLLMLLLGLMLDTSVSKKMMYIYIFFCFIQWLMFKYLNIMPLLMCKDIFWYTVVLNVAFVWHVLMLNWLFNMSLLLKWDYGCFMFSRWSILTGLTFIYWGCNWMLYVFECLNEDTYYLNEMYKNENVNDKLKMFCLTHLNLNIFNSKQVTLKTFCLNYLNSISMVLALIAILLSMCSYFMSNFSNYSLLLLGKKSVMDLFKKSWKMYFLVMITFIFSILMCIPSIYMMWFVLFCYTAYIELFDYWQTLQKPTVSKYELYFNIWSEDKLLLENEQSCCIWKDIYEEEFYLDYVIFLEDLNWSTSSTATFSFINMFDICDIFMYSKDSSDMMLMNYISAVFKETGPMMKEIDIFVKKFRNKLSSEQLMKLAFPEYGTGKDIEDSLPWSQCKNVKTMTLWEFTFKKETGFWV